MNCDPYALGFVRGYTTNPALCDLEPCLRSASDEWYAYWTGLEDGWQKRSGRRIDVLVWFEEYIDGRRVIWCERLSIEDALALDPAREVKLLDLSGNEFTVIDGPGTQVPRPDDEGAAEPGEKDPTDD